MTKPKTFWVASPISSSVYVEKKLSDFTTINSLLSSLNLSTQAYFITVQTKSQEIIDDVGGSYSIGADEYITISRNTQKSG
tara:strand:- start:136 stop:378 length:243 start_codon:yes stop_codon:yes gene_type:complete